MEEPLIEFVKKNKCLYDKSHRDYKNILIRNQKFEELSRKLNIPEKNLKARWRTLRDHFHKEQRVVLYDSRVSSSSKKPWKWLDQLMFLKDAKNSSSSTPAKFPPRMRTEFWYSDSADGTSTIDDSNTTQDFTPPKSKVDFSRAAKFNFVEEETSTMHATPLRDLEQEDEFIIDESNDRSCTVTQDVLATHHVKGSSAVQLFFTGLAKQTEDANITAKQFAQLQMKLLKVFNKEIYNI